MTTVPQNVVVFLQSHKEQPYCDSCLHKTLGLARHQQAQQATAPLAASPGFKQGPGICTVCGKPRKVTSAI
jgi:hypothetical protein